MGFRAKFLIGLAAVLVIASLAFWLLNRSTRPPGPPLPSPNGYDDFVRAYAVYKEPSKFITDMNEEELGVFLKDNEETFRWIQEGLTHSCRVPLEPSIDYFEHRSQELTISKAVAQAWGSQVRLQRAQHQPDEALRLGLQSIQFAHESTRGGLLIDALVGVAMETIATRALLPLDEVSAQACRQAVGQLQRIDATAESPEHVFAHERWYIRQHPLRLRLAAYLNEFIQNQSLQPFKSHFNSFVKKHQQVTLGRRRLLLELARRAYLLEKGQFPNQDADLVPAYLPALPLDPTTGQPLQ